MKKKITAYATIAGNIKRESGFLYHFLNRARSILLLSFKRAPSPQFRPFLCCHREAGGEHTVVPMSLFIESRRNRKQQSKFGAGRGNLLLRILFNARAFYIQGVILIYREAMRFPGNRGGACMVFCEAKEAPPALSEFYRWIKLAAGKTYC